MIIDHIRGARSLRQLPSRKVAISVVTRCELFAGRLADEAQVSRLLSPMEQIPVDLAIAERAGRLRRSTGIATPDALIAATALEQGLTLMTRNVRHFGRVPELSLADGE
ncbi:MAG: type II toxin-antitoxin system VapC family toxin [Solirubrobacterales bacterium]